MYESKLRKALLAAAELADSSDSNDINAMFDALVNIELISRTAVEDHLIATSLRPEWRATAMGSALYH
jgi:hypothetical protein